MTKRKPSSNSHLLPGLIQEREREFNARMTQLSRTPSQVPICNATTPGTYRTGDGEVLQHPRPGSLRAFTLPSHGDRT